MKLTVNYRVIIYSNIFSFLSLFLLLLKVQNVRILFQIV